MFINKRKLAAVTVLTFLFLVAAVILGLYINPHTRWLLTFLSTPFNWSQESDLESLNTYLKALEGDGDSPGSSPSESAASGASPRKMNDNSGSPGTAPGMTSNSSNQPVVTVSDKQKEIEKRYLRQLEETALSYESKLNSLVAQGVSEYNSYINQGRQAPITDLARKYVAAGSVLEAECDARFYSTLNNFRAELNRNSFSTRVVDLAKKEYEKAKAGRKRQLLSKALHHN